MVLKQSKKYKRTLLFVCLKVKLKQINKYLLET